VSTAVAERTAGPAGVPVLQRIFSFPAMLAGLLVVLAVLTVRSRFDDPDMWWHLRTGQIIWTTRTIPLTDLFSYTTGHHFRVPHEWLSQVLIYGAYRLGGYSGLMLWLCLSTVALLIAGYALCWLYSGNAKVGFLGAMIICLFATSGLSIRPQMIGYLLLILELLLVHLGRTRNPRWFFWLPPLFALWVNCHGTFFLGLVIGGAVLLCSLVNFRIGPLVPSPWDSRTRQMLALALLLSAAALFLNPVGVKQVLYPLNLMMHQPINLSQVEEWRPLQLTDGRGLLFLATLGSLFLVMIVRRSELFWDELLMLMLGIGLAANHRRMVFVFGILAAPILSRLLAPLWDGYHAEEDRALPNAVLIAASLLIAFWSFPSLQNLTRQVDDGNPVKAVDFMKTHHLSGRMLNDYTYGGYLIWAAPEHPVFVYGGADLVDWAGVVDEFGKWATLQSDPSALLDKYGVDFCLLAQQSPMVRVLPLLNRWKAIYTDNRSVIFMRVGADRPSK
jgi:hypothetical protein